MEAKRLIAVSIGKISEKRKEKSGLDLRRSILVCSVLQAATESLIIIKKPEIFSTKQPVRCRKSSSARRPTSAPLLDNTTTTTTTKSTDMMQCDTNNSSTTNSINNNNNNNNNTTGHINTTKTPSVENFDHDKENSRPQSPQQTTTTTTQDSFIVEKMDIDSSSDHISQNVVITTKNNTTTSSGINSSNDNTNYSSDRTTTTTTECLQQHPTQDPHPPPRPSPAKKPRMEVISSDNEPTSPWSLSSLVYEFNSCFGGLTGKTGLNSNSPQTPSAGFQSLESHNNNWIQPIEACCG